MLGISLLDNPIRHYAWGSRTAIARLQRRSTPSSQPEAELWMGAHAAAPSRVRVGSEWLPLPQLLRDRANAALGPRASADFAGELPFLLKLLAAGEPLSIQAHPDSAQARAGFERENAAGVPLDAPERNYRDPHPKPELICALTAFWALRGFRSAQAIVAGFRRFGIEEFATEVDSLERAGDGAGHRDFYAAIAAAPGSRIGRAIAQARRRLDPSRSDAERWLAKLAAAHPTDPGALAPLFLNLVCLGPGDAMYLDAGELHCYLEGVGVEVMANSDNVLRGGLTQKHVDVPELLRTLRFRSGDPEVLRPVERTVGERVYETPAKVFELAVLELDDVVIRASDRERGPEIWFASEGDAEFRELGRGSSCALSQGQALFVPDCVRAYEISGSATLYRAALPARPI